MTLYEEYLKSLGFPENADEYWYLEKFDNFTRSLDERDKAIAKYAWAILTEGTISKLQKYGPFLEIGSGSGYWAYEFHKRGIPIIATDPSFVWPPKKRNKNSIEQARWVIVDLVSGLEALKKYDDGMHTLLFVWPEYAKSWAYEVLKEFKGNIVVYVGEDGGGCTADEQLHNLLDKEWKKIEEIAIPQWPGIHDTVMVYKRSFYGN